ncbi:MAG TPA: hypothetical protein VH619_07845 [Verrucomicrobiae bacterium]|jgi:hypothetical protein|nr:hypothetical protein [Verrucomicrobiae bacterium]
MIKRFLLFLALAGCSLQVRAAIPPPEKLLPKDTVLVITAPDWPRAWAFATNSQYGRLWQDPALRPFREKFIDKLTSDAVKPTEKTLGIHFADFQGLPQGQVTFALLPVGQKENSDHHFAQVLLIDTKSHAGQLKTNLASIAKKWVDAGKALKTQKIREVEFTTLIVSPGDLSWNKIFPQPKTDLLDDTSPKPPEKNSEITFGQVDSLLVASDSTEAIEKVLTLENGGLLPPLSDQPAFQADFAARLRDSPFYCWVNVKSLVDILTTPPAGADEDVAASAAKLGTFVSSLGLSGITSASLTYEDLPGGTGAQFFLGAPESKRTGILKLLTPGLKDANPPAFVPADAVKFWRWRIDIPHSWGMLESMLDNLNPELKRVMDFILQNAGKDKDEHYDLKSELLNNLGDDVLSYEKAPVGNTMDELKSPPAIYLIGSPNPDKLASAMSVALSILGRSSGGVKDREFLGRKIHSVTVGGGNEGAEPQGQSFSFAASGSYLAMSTDPGIVEEYLRSSDNTPKALSDTPGLSDAAQQVGGFSSGWFGYENQSLNMRPTFDLFRKSPPTLSDITGAPGMDSSLSVAGQIAGKVLSWSDFSLLPPFDSVSKYFSYSVYAGRFSPEGFTLKIFAPTPPALR